MRRSNRCPSTNQSIRATGHEYRRGVGHRRRVRAHRQTRTVTYAMSDEFGLTAEERAQMIPSGRAKLMDNRVGWSLTHLSQAGLIERPVRAQVKITPAGAIIITEDVQIRDALLRIGLGHEPGHRPDVDEARRTTARIGPRARSHRGGVQLLPRRRRRPGRDGHRPRAGRRHSGRPSPAQPGRAPQRRRPGRVSLPSHASINIGQGRGVRGLRRLGSAGRRAHG